MRGLIIAALGLLLLVSGAVATGSGNFVQSEVFQDSSGTCIVGANLAQATVLDANMLGCDNSLQQFMSVTADDNSLLGNNFNGLIGGEGEGAGTGTGAGEGEGNSTGNSTGGEGGAGEGEFFMGMNFVQGGEMVFNATGSDNVGYQDVDLFANGNCQTFGNFSQMGIQRADAIGCDNNLFQDTDAYAGVIADVPESSGNSFTMSNTQQASLLDICTVGDANDLDQHAEQDLFDNCLTHSSFTQQALLTQDVWGCNNSGDLEAGAGENDHGQSSLQNVYDSSFTMSMGGQAVSENWQATGSDNMATQFGDELISDSCFTGAIATQSITENLETLGCDNAVDQDALFTIDDNSMVGGRLAQSTVIKTNL